LSGSPDIPFLSFEEEEGGGKVKKKKTLNYQSQKEKREGKGGERRENGRRRSTAFAVGVCERMFSQRKRNRGWGGGGGGEGGQRDEVKGFQPFLSGLLGFRSLSDSSVAQVRKKGE
jgi:hypothetical protein